MVGREGAEEVVGFCDVVLGRVVEVRGDSRIVTDTRLGESRSARRIP